MVLVTELWARGHLFRTFTVGSSGIRIASGKASQDVMYAAKSFGVKQEALILSSYGRERWYHNLSALQMKERLRSFRKGAEQDGFTKLGTAKL